MQLRKLNKLKASRNQILQDTPLSKVDSHHHSNDAYKHAVHNLSFFDTSYHMPNLDGKEPTLDSVKGCQYQIKLQI